MITAIRATSRTLVEFLQAQFEADPHLGPSFSGAGGMRVHLNTPAEMTFGRSGLSVWLYRVTRDPCTLNRPPERISPTQMRPPPLPLRLHYLLAPIITGGVQAAAELEQVILGKTMQVLHIHPQLCGVDLKDDFQGTRTVVTSRFESMTIVELGQIWEALATSYRTSVSYEVTVVDIETPIQTQTAAPVEVPILESAVIVGGP